MTTHNPYLWMTGLAAAHFQAQHAQSKKQHLTLITPDQMPSKGRKPKMSNTPDREAPASTASFTGTAWAAVALVDMEASHG